MNFESLVTIPQVTKVSFYLSFFCYSDCINLFSISLILSSVISTLLLDPSNEFFILLVLFFSYIIAIISFFLRNWDIIHVPLWFFL